VAHQIAAEKHRPLEDAAGDELLAGEVRGDLRTHLGNALVDLRLGD
jgi:hypothetical protein